MSAVHLFRHSIMSYHSFTSISVNPWANESFLANAMRDPRYPLMPRWLHEHCPRTNWRTCQRKHHQSIWRRVHSREQWFVVLFLSLHQRLATIHTHTSLHSFFLSRVSPPFSPFNSLASLLPSSHAFALMSFSVLQFSIFLPSNLFKLVWSATIPNRHVLLLSSRPWLGLHVVGRNTSSSSGRVMAWSIRMCRTHVRSLANIRSKMGEVYRKWWLFVSYPFFLLIFADLRALHWM